MYEQEQGHAAGERAAEHQQAVDVASPGQISRTADLVGRARPIVSGLLQRKATRDGNGVADGAHEHVMRAAASTGSALPTTLLRKFEASLGADLSGVRVHTGGDSEAAAEAVGAKAYTVGQDVHFGAGQMDASTPAGEHLLAHEVAHTVQQQSGVGRRAQFKLDVSSPGDAHEIEADRAADAMVSGGSYAIGGGASAGGIHRAAVDPNDTKDSKSVSNGQTHLDNQKGNGEQQRAEAEKEAAKLKGGIDKLGSFVSKYGGVTMDPSALLDSLRTSAQNDSDKYIAKIDAEINRRKNKPGGLIGIDVPVGPGPDDAHPKMRTVTSDADLQKARDALAGQSSLGSAIMRASMLAAQANKQIKSFVDVAKEMNDKLGAIDPEALGKLDQMTQKVASVISLVQHIDTVLDTEALDQFSAHPSFATAKIWSEHVGAVFSSLSGIGGALKEFPGLGEVTSGLLNTPQVVIQQFTSIVEERYRKIDEATAQCNGELLKGGTESSCQKK